MKVNRQQLAYYIQRKYNRTPEQVFDQEQTPQHVRNNIIDDVFQTFSGYQVTPIGLVHLENEYDRFPQYRTHHLHSIEGLIYDVNRSARIRKRPLNRIKMQVKKTKMKFRAKKHYRLQLKRNREQYLKMWAREPKRELTPEQERFNERKRRLDKNQNKQRDIDRYRQR